MSSREEDGQRPTLGLAHDRGLLGARSVHDRADVVHANLEWGGAGNPIGHAEPALVEHDQPGELGEALAVATEGGELPFRFEMGIRALDVHQVDRPRAHDLVRDVHLTTSGEPHLRHGARVARRDALVNGSPLAPVAVRAVGAPGR